MNVAETLRGMARRWYITVPGLVLAIAVGLGAWFAVPPAYQRSASVLLLPGASSLPDADANPYLYLGSLTSAAEVLVRAVGSENTVRAIEEAYPGGEIEVSRDGAAGGPVVRIVATGSTDAEAEAIAADLLVRTEQVLDDLQAEQGVPPVDRITLSTITVDDASVIQQRARIGTAAALAVVVALLALVTAAVVDGFSRRRRAVDGEDEPETDGAGADTDGDHDHDAAAAEATLPVPAQDGPVPPVAAEPAAPRLSSRPMPRAAVPAREAEHLAGDASGEMVVRDPAMKPGRGPRRPRVTAGAHRLTRGRS